MSNDSPMQWGWKSVSMAEAESESQESAAVPRPNGTFIGSGALFEGKLTLQGGAVVGDVSARRQMVLREGARLHGKIETACLEIERHAFFQGVTSMTEPQAIRREPAEAQPAVSTPAAPI